MTHWSTVFDAGVRVEEIVVMGGLILGGNKMVMMMVTFGYGKTAEYDDLGVLGDKADVRYSWVDRNTYDRIYLETTKTSLKLLFWKKVS